VACHALDSCRAKLVLVSRPGTSDAYVDLREKFTNPAAVSRHFFTIPGRKEGEEGEAEFRDFIRKALQAYGKDSSLGTASKFYEYYQDDLTALFDAIGGWEQEKPITTELADSRLRKWLESSEDLKINAARDPALAAFLAVAGFWQFEIPVGQDFLGHILGLDRSIPETLADRGVLVRSGQPGKRKYELDHELRARRCLRVVGTNFDLPSPLVQKFTSESFTQPNEGVRLTAHLLLLDIVKSDLREQVGKLVKLNARMLLSSYAYDYLEVTGIFRDNLALFKPLAQIEVLFQGGAFRRRKGDPDGESWLNEAYRLHCSTAESEALGKILYEQAYLLYNKNDFTHAEDIFARSAAVSKQKIGKLMSEAKAIEAGFRDLLSADLFSRNGASETAEPPEPSGLEAIREKLEACLNQFQDMIGGLSADDSSDERTLSHARQWRVKCLHVLAEMRLEQGKLRESKDYLRKASEGAKEMHYYAIRPILKYLEGRVALMEKDLERAVELLTEADEEYERYGEEGRGDLLITLGDAYLLKPDSRSAQERYKRCSRLNVMMRNQRAVNAARQRLG